MNRLVLAQQPIASEFWPDADLAKLEGHGNLGWWIGHLRQAEASIRRHRKRLEALREGAALRVCPGCGGPVTGRADAIYCGTTCRVRAYRTRTPPGHASGTSTSPSSAADAGSASPGGTTTGPDGPHRISASNMPPAWTRRP